MDGGMKGVAVASSSDRRPQQRTQHDGSHQWQMSNWLARVFVCGVAKPEVLERGRRQNGELVL